MHWKVIVKGNDSVLSIGTNLVLPMVKPVGRVGPCRYL